MLSVYPPKLPMVSEMNAVSVWTVYHRPDDFPNNYVARRFEVTRGEVSATNQVIVANNLAAIRRHLEQHFGELQRVTRMAGDDPAVVETWI
jgi:hypothetical protein